jgi:AraC family transcriptional regulator
LHQIIDEKWGKKRNAKRNTLDKK